MTRAPSPASGESRVREIAGALGGHYATVSRRLRAFEEGEVRSARPNPDFSHPKAPFAQRQSGTL